ncbi:MAG: Bug family tripartite tricarboxylate transporter substrate binding protein [Burkholderiales bacterium]
MKRNVRFLDCVLGATVLTALTTSLGAQTYPVKPIKTIVTVAGGIDLVARLVSQGLQESMGQPVVVETMPGAGGSIGHEAVARAAPDGYTLMMSVASTHITNGFLSVNSRFDPVKGYTPIGRVAESILLLSSDISAPYNNVAEMVVYARKNPGKLAYGTTGIGSAHHFSAAAISSLTGIDWVHVPYKSGPQVLTDMMSGQVQIGWAIYATLVPFEKTGKVRILGINSGRRFAKYPNIPTVTEQIPGYEPPPTWASYFGPAGMQAGLVQRLNAEMVKIVTSPDIRAKIEASGTVVSPSTPEELGDMVKRDIVSVGKVVKLVGIKPE